ncbi:hypothetical protein FHS31_001938 [Sphingomonas vulcanisoli]|uniref:Uncharacterized protein n=1 Tax=Sphingomonas vulcanisoli TaxID=1658060 RepID=A0ABX0TXF7_9SPHN|nr:hypothetical protein [Sphingomonas vulcanisoli]NIJ08321.1 hypothetical protein [Sphingomonas vulcanisoli]
MAYINFSADPLSPAPTMDKPVSTAGHFSPLEWTTIALARTDGLASLREPSRLSRAMGSLFGRSTHSRLADPMLERLRRLAVNAWHYGYQLPVSETKAFLAAGFSVDQLELVLASVGQARSERRRRAL